MQQNLNCQKFQKMSKLGGIWLIWSGFLNDRCFLWNLPLQEIWNLVLSIWKDSFQKEIFYLWEIIKLSWLCFKIVHKNQHDSNQVLIWKGSSHFIYKCVLIRLDSNKDWLYLYILDWTPTGKYSQMRRAWWSLGTKTKSTCLETVQ